MKKLLKATISVILVLSMLMMSSVTIFAADEEELYICELRLIYAEDYSEALDILDDSDFYDYELLDVDLNSNTGETGVWLAYKTTTDVNDAITDVAVMQMKGGYKEGNYQEALRKSYEEYVEMGRVYLEAIEYWKSALNANDLLAKAAGMQLDFYTGLDNHGDETLGEIFYDGIDEYELATLFLQGNVYALNNIRSLLSMGVSYNPDGEHYLKKVSAEAKRFEADSDVYYNEDNFDELAIVVSGTILTFKEMFEEYESVEDSLNYFDDDMTEKELIYAEYASMAERLRETDYLNGESFYDFCIDYELDTEDYSSLYPLIAALNEGQLAMTRVNHYYDVVRYCLTEVPEETLFEEITDLMDKYESNPFNVYTGVDRSIYEGTFALTSAAYRADASTEGGFMEYMLSNYAFLGISGITAGSVGTLLCIWGLGKTVKAHMLNAAADRMVASAQLALDNVMSNAYNAVATTDISTLMGGDVLGYAPGVDNTILTGSCDDVISSIYGNYFTGNPYDIMQMSFQKKFEALMTNPKVSGADLQSVQMVQDHLAQVSNDMGATAQSGLSQAQTTAEGVREFATNVGAGTGVLYLVGGIMMLYSAIALGITIYNYYHPEYDDIPMAMADLVDTEDGDRYIKYDVVCEVDAQNNGEYAAADLNAFEAQRWNALYYTKSYEAGKPLLAEFDVSYDNNQPEDDCAPVHRFGEVLCYDLNKYNFDSDSDNIYLSIMQSEKQKSAVADVPEIVGSMFSVGWVLLAGGIGVLAGIGATVGTHAAMKKKKGGAAKMPEA